MLELKPGEAGRVVSVGAAGEIKLRLLDMGIIRGCEFRVVRRAPLGDPVEIKIRGFLLALRKAEAQTVIVEKISSASENAVMGKKKRKD